MKKTMTIIGALVFALAVGSAYALPIEEVSPGDMSNDNYAYNGISVLDTGPGCSIAEGVGAGGLSSESPGMELGNGITGFDAGMSRFEIKSACAESELSAGPTRDNGVTVFDTAPIEAN